MTTSRWQIVLTIRTDSFSELQKHPRFEDWEARPLRSARGEGISFRQPNRGTGSSLRRVRRTAVIDALIEDAPRKTRSHCSPSACSGCGGNTRPQARWRSTITRGVGRLSGLIEDGAERALRGISPDEGRPAVDAAAQEPARPRSVDFVPALAQVNDRGATIRRIATGPVSPRNSASCSRTSTNGGSSCARASRATVEVAHEALFREWSGWRVGSNRSVSVWRAALTASGRLTWDRNGRGCRVPQSQGQTARRDGRADGN